MKNAIFTACDEKYGGFLVNHWLRSLKENVKLKEIDIIVLDYGLDDGQRAALKNEKVKIVKCIKDGHVTVIRLRDISSYLKNHSYNQVLVTDGGDLIFQEDIGMMFSKSNSRIKAVCEINNLAFQDYFLEGYVKEEFIGKIKSALKGKKMVNCGVICGPAKKIEGLFRKSYAIIVNNTSFGPDQVAINYFLYKDTFLELEDTYNFVIQTMDRPFSVRKGVFYLGEEKIKIVHNAGRISLIRPIDDFGYGENYNHPKWFMYYALRLGITFINDVKRVFSG